MRSARQGHPWSNNLRYKACASGGDQDVECDDKEHFYAGINGSRNYAFYMFGMGLDDE
jgi:hypothetical protein